MKIILALGWYFPDAFGGTELYVDGLAQRLKSRGHELTVVAPLRGAESPRNYEHQKIPVFRYPQPSEDSSRDECQTRVPSRGSEVLLRWLAAQRPDILHLNTIVPSLSIFEVEAARSLGIRVIATCHLGDLGYLCQRGTLMRWGSEICDGKVKAIKCAGCGLHAGGVPRILATPIATVGRALGRSASGLPGRMGTVLGMADLIRHRQNLQRRLLSALDRFVLLNHAAYERVLLNGAPREKLAINQLGISHVILRKPGPQASPTTLPVRFGYVGRFTAIKGVLDLARAWRALSPELPVTLDWIGPTLHQEARDLQAEAKRIMGNDKRVSFFAAVSSSDIGELLKRLDVLIVPSRCFEGGPTVVHESFAAGTPVIGTRIGAMPELIIDGVNGRLVAPANAPEIAAAICEIANDPAATVDRWRRALPPPRTMDEIAADYEKLYEDVLREPLSSAAQL